ncbi:MAG: amino acid adenylation domain-containing protein [Acidobacteriota bacterium]
MSPNPPPGRQDAGPSDARRELLAARLQGKIGAARPSLDGIARRERPPRHRASLGQEWIYLAQQSSPTSPSFNVTSSFRVSGNLDVERLEDCVNQVVARHEPLRSNFRRQDGGVQAIVQDTPAIRIHRHRCEDDEVERKAEGLVRRPFDLENEPLLRLYYLDTGGGHGLLTLVVHDIVFDKWSLGLFWKEVAVLYRAAGEGSPAALGELPIRHADFADWQREWLDSGRIDGQLTFWKRALDGLPGPIPLPTDKPYPAELTDAGRLERWRLSPAVTRSLKALAAAEKVSLFTLLLSTFHILLYRYTGVDDVVVGSPVANRRRRETVDLIGFFLTTVVVRAMLRADLTARDAIRQVGGAVAGAIENQDLPFDRVVRAVAPPRVPGRHPLFQVMFVYQREAEAAPALNLGEVNLRHVYIETGTSKFDLTLFAAESGEGMETILEYRTDLFEPDTIQRLLRHYEQLLESIARDPDQPVSELEMLTVDERRQLFGAWQGETFPLAGVPGLIAQIQQHAAKNPDAPAVISASGNLTYRQLDEASEGIARQLVSLGAGSGRPVAHFARRTPGSIAGIIGILKAGAAYVPIDPEYPADRRRFIIRHTAIETAVTTSALRPEISALVAQTVLLDQAGPSPAVDGAVALLPPDEQQAAYVIYTSGSTGDPKGVVVSHRNLLHSTEARGRYYATAPHRLLLTPSFAFDSSVAGIFWTLSQGGALVLADADDQRDPARLRGLIRTHEVSDLLCIPTLYREILAGTPTELRSLTRVIVAGESCPSDLVALHRQRLVGTALFNEYGPTEVTVWATVHTCRPEDGFAGRPVPIGRPIANSQAYVLDAHGQALPVGIAGELWLAGEGVAQGYFGRDELTRERFVDRVVPGAGMRRLYRSGDMARWRRDGLLDFLGRNDDQIKLRGFRIEPGEIESVLEQHPGILRAVVVAVPADSRSGTEAIGVEVLADLIREVPHNELDAALTAVESLSAAAVDMALGVGAEAASSRPERTVSRDRFRVELHTAASGFIAPPRETQRNWLLGRAMAEFADDLEHLDAVAPSFVRGFEHQLGQDLRDISQAVLTDQEIMEDWQTPVMKAMARHVATGHGDVLEIGFGRGVSAEFIQQFGVRSHTIVESNDHSVSHHFRPWRERRPDHDIRLFHARWQDIESQLGLFDGIFFHAFPMNEREFDEYVLRSVTFAEHGFGAMAAHLKDGGVFTYLTTEIDSLGRGHQRRLLQHFREVVLHVEKVRVPEDTRDTWWADSMVVVKAVK